MLLSGSTDFGDAIGSAIVVFGGALAGLLLSFSVAQINEALQMALTRAIHGGSSPRQMIRAMLKVCEVSRRDGLLGVADIRTNSSDVEQVCQLIGDASEESCIRYALDKRIGNEKITHQMTQDVFVFTAIYAMLFGILGSLLRFVSAAPEAVLVSSTFLPFVCGSSLSILMSLLIARLRAAHMRELVIAEIAFRGASIMLQDNNVQRLQSRLALIVPAGLRR